MYESVQNQTLLRKDAERVNATPSASVEEEVMRGAVTSEGQPAPDEASREAYENTLRSYQEGMAQREAMFLQELSEERGKREGYEQAIVGNYIRALPPDRQNIANQLLQYNEYVKDLTNQNQFMRSYAGQLQEAVLPLVKGKIFKHLSEQHGVEEELLAKYAETPQDVEKIIKAITEYRKKSGFETRKTQGNDRVPQSSGQSSASNNMPELKKKYQNSGNVREYIKEMQKAGLW